MTLPTHKPDAVCPKCGRGEIPTTYIVGWNIRCEHTYAPLSALHDGARACCHYYHGEHLHRECRCGYAWAEAVLSPGPTILDESERTRGTTQ